MSKCRNCGADIDERVNLCPKCGLSPSVETITNLPRWRDGGKKADAKRRDEKKKRRMKRPEARVCKNCGVDIDERVNLCPKCGLSPSVETITSFTPLLPPGRRRKKKED